MDRFKFRIFSKLDNTVYDVHTLHLETNTAVVSSKQGLKSIRISEETPLMQCTGLRDKNGTLIFEGDIVKQIYLDDVNLVHFAYGCFFKGSIEFCYLNEESLQVIGNIYEHKHLLENSDA